MSQPEKVGFSSERLNRIHPVMQGYIDRGQTGAIITLVERQGQIVHQAKFGFQDIEEQIPLEYDHIFRIFSMTKPIVSLGLLMLFEQAQLQLFDPVEVYLPEFKGIKVWESDGNLVSPKSKITIHHLLNHTAGLTYGAFGVSAVDQLYQEAKLSDRGQTLEEMVRKIADLPLVGHPGEQWVYSVATDVVGRIIEVVSGMSLAQYLTKKILGPLNMQDTVFSVPADKLHRLTTCYVETPKQKMAVRDHRENSEFQEVALFSGGGGLVSTLEDYLTFTHLLLNKGEINGVRLVGRKTIELMTANSLPPKLVPIAVSEPDQGFGFGLGFKVLLDVAQTRALGSLGTYGWGGIASTTFFVDPVEELIGIMLSQVIIMNGINLQQDFRTLVYQALVD